MRARRAQYFKVRVASGATAICDFEVELSHRGSLTRIGRVASLAVAPADGSLAFAPGLPESRLPDALVIDLRVMAAGTLTLG